MINSFRGGQHHKHTKTPIRYGGKNIIIFYNKWYMKKK
jgi:hypothetical protein